MIDMDELTVYKILDWISDQAGNYCSCRPGSSSIMECYKHTSMYLHDEIKKNFLSNVKKVIDNEKKL